MKLRTLLQSALALTVAAVIAPVASNAQWIVAAPNIFTAAATPFVGHGTNTPLDRLHIHTVNPNMPYAACRITTDFAGCMATSQLAMEPNVGAPVYSLVATRGDLVIRTVNQPNDPNIGYCAEDIILAAQTFNGAIRLTTGQGTTETEKVTVINNGFTGIGTMLPGGTGNPAYRLEIQSGDLGITDLAHRRAKIRLYRDGVAGDPTNAGHAIGTEQYYNTYGPAQNYCGTTSLYPAIGHKFYNDCNNLVATIGHGGFGLPLSQKLLSRFYGNLWLDGAFMPAGNPGNAGDLLVSNGAGASPLWQAPGTVVGAHAWLLTGNAGTTPLTNFLGTTDSVDLVVRTDNVERMRVRAGGNVGIGRSNPSALLHVGINDLDARINIGSVEYIRDAGPNQLMLGSATVIPSSDCGFSIGNATSRWNTIYACNGTINTSDLRQKDNVRELGYGLAEVLQLRPVSFTWKERPEEGAKLGLIAQELQKVLPEVVKDPSTELRYDEQGNLVPPDPNAPLGVYYADIIPVLVKAIQEQQQHIAALEARLAAPSENTVADPYENVLLEQNNPNPFSESTTIMYYIPADVAGKVELVVADANGSTVLERYPVSVNTPQQITVSARGLDTGVYVYGIAVNGRIVKSKKMMIMK